MSIKIESISTGFSVSFPKELIENFKQIFKNAKFNWDTYCWEVGPRSGTKLQQWAEAVQPVVADIEAAEAAELSEKELMQLQTEVANMRAAIAKERREKLSYSDTAAALTAARDELAKATVELSLEKSEKAAKAAEAKALVSRICDLNAVCEAHNIMTCNHNKVGSQHRNAFNDARAVIKEQHEKLNAIGFISEGMAQLQSCNFNRPDRDNPRNVGSAEVLNIRKIQE